MHNTKELLLMNRPTNRTWEIDKVLFKWTASPIAILVLGNDIIQSAR